MNQGVTIGLAALLAGGVGGFLVGRSADSTTEETSKPGKGGELRVLRSDARGDSDSRGKRAGSSGEVMREPGQLARLQSLMDLYAGMDAAQLEAEADALDSLPMGERIMASMLLFSRWGEIDPQGALEFTKTMGFGGMFARPTVLRSWASMDPVNAAQYYTDNPRDFRMMGGRGPGGRGDGGAGVVAGEWAKQDPQAALEWAQGLDGRDRSSALVSVLGEMASKDPAEAAGVASGLEEDDRNRAYSEIAERWASTDFDSAEAWINTLSGEDKQDALAAAIGTLADRDPVAASQKVASMSEGDERNRAVRDVASEWSREAPADAAQWVLEQGESGRAIQSVVSNWTSQDSAAALGFVNDQPAGDFRDSAVEAYLRSDRDMEPSQTVALAESIADERDRNMAIWRTTGRWMREDEASARSYVEGLSSISDDFKEKILSGAGRDDRGGRGGRGR